MVIRKKRILHRQISEIMLIKFVSRIICYSELNEIKIKILIKIYQIFQAKKSDTIREKSINRYKNDIEENIIS